MGEHYDLFLVNREKDYDRIPVILDDSVQQVPLTANGRVYASRITSKVEDTKIEELDYICLECKHEFKGKCVKYDGTLCSKCNGKILPK